MKYLSVLCFCASLLLSCGTQKENQKADSEMLESESFACPMACEGHKVYDEPGNCPVCEMDLKKVVADIETPAHDSIH